MQTTERRLQNWEPNKNKKDRFAPPMEGVDDDIAIRDADSGLITVIQKRVDVASMVDLPEMLRHLRLRGYWSMANPKGIQRASGIKAKEQWFGWTPPDALRQRYAVNRSRLYTNNPVLGSMIDQVTAKLWNEIVAIDESQAELHTELVKQSIHPDYHLAGTPFTSGIINHTNVLPYHKDSGNLSGTWSMMLSLRKGVDGGALHIPEYDLTIGVPDCSVMFFNGQRYWHGVTPIHLQNQNSYRFTLVWYVKNAIVKCGAYEHEAERAAQQAYEAAQINNPLRKK